MKSPITLVTTFGLGRTPAQVGMIEVLAEQGIVIDRVVGTSLGAVNAAAVAAGTGTAQLRSFWKWLDTEIYGVPMRTLSRSMSIRQARKQQDQVREQIAGMVPDTFGDLPKPLRLVGTDLRTGSAVVMDSGNLPDAVMASSALPAVMPPVDLGYGPVIDGGLVAGMPLDAIEAGTGTAIVLDTGAASVSVEAAAGYRWWEVGAMAYAHLIRGQAVNALVRAAGLMPVVLISTSAQGLLDFSDPDDLFEAGRTAATDLLSGLPDRLRKKVYGLPTGVESFPALKAVRAP